MRRLSNQRYELQRLFESTHSQRDSDRLVGRARSKFHDCVDKSP
jgi:hypothetical protein